MVHTWTSHPEQSKPNLRLLLILPPTHHYTTQGFRPYHPPCTTVRNVDYCNNSHSYLNPTGQLHQTPQSQKYLKKLPNRYFPVHVHVFIKRTPKGEKGIQNPREEVDLCQNHGSLWRNSPASPHLLHQVASGAYFLSPVPPLPFPERVLHRLSIDENIWNETHKH